MNDKKIIYDILTDITLSPRQKLEKIKEIYGDYLENKNIKKIIFEKIEGFFHDALWTYFELLIHEKLTKLYSLEVDFIDQKVILQRLDNACNLYLLFFENDEYSIDYEREIVNIRFGSEKAVEVMKQYVWDKKATNITHSKDEYTQGNARDIFLSIENGEDINFSLKIDKSWKVALFDGQTGKIFEKVYSRYFNLSEFRYNQILEELFPNKTESDIREDYYNIAYLTQVIIIEQFGLKNAQVNNLKDGIITNLENLKHFIKALKYYKSWKDNSFVIKVNRLTWEVGIESDLENMDEINLNLEDFSMTDCKPKKWPYGIEPTFKFKNKAFVSFQIKHQRWKNPSNKFTDITIRMRVK